MNLATETRSPDGGDPSVQTPLSAEEMTAYFPNFEILECLGRGGMGVVYKARQKTLDREVAIKVLAGEWQGDPEFAVRFEREAKTLAQMSHPSIVTVHDFGDANGLYYILMEYIDGVNLRELLSDGRLEPEQALSIVPPVCDALEYAHGKGVVHRDIKPENLLLDRNGRVKIADFGIATLVGSTRDVSGTPTYMAPEQISGRVDRRADIYAMGVVLYEMLTGERPGTDVLAPSKTIEIDVKIDEVVLRALEREPERRYQSAAEFRTTAERVLKPQPVARRLPRWVESWIQVSTAYRWAVLVVMLTLGLAMTTAFCAPRKQVYPGRLEVWSYGFGKPWYESVRDGARAHNYARLDLETPGFVLGGMGAFLWTGFALLHYAESQAGSRLKPADQVFVGKLTVERNGREEISARQVLIAVLVLGGATAVFSGLCVAMIHGILGTSPVPGPVMLLSTIAVWCGSAWGTRRHRRDPSTSAVIADFARDTPGKPPVMVDGGTRSLMVQLLEVIAGSHFQSELAMRFANWSALGFLGFVSFVHNTPVPGSQYCRVFSGFFGFFGFVVVAYGVERMHRRRKEGQPGPPSLANPSAPTKSRAPAKRSFWLVLLMGFLACVSLVGLALIWLPDGIASFQENPDGDRNSAINARTRLEGLDRDKVPVMDRVLLAKRILEREKAIECFLQAEWSSRPLFLKGSALSLSESEFVVLSNRQRKAASSFILAGVRDIRDLAMAVRKEGQKAKNRRDFDRASNCFEALQRCGVALDDPDGLLAVRLVGRVMQDMAQSESSSFHNLMEVAHPLEQSPANNEYSDLIRREAN